MDKTVFILLNMGYILTVSYFYMSKLYAARQKDFIVLK